MNLEPLRIQSSMPPQMDDSEDIASPCAEFDLPELAGPDDTDRGDFSLVTGADQWLVHAFTGVAHVQVDEELDKVACGRKITSNLRVVAYSDLLESDAVLCKQCESAHMRFAQAQLDDDQGIARHPFRFRPALIHVEGSMAKSLRSLMRCRFHKLQLETSEHAFFSRVFQKTAFSNCVSC